MEALGALIYSGSHFFKDLFYFNYMHLCLGVGLYTQEDVKSHVAEVISIYEPSNMGAENLTPVLCKSNKCL